MSIAQSQVQEPYRRRIETPEAHVFKVDLPGLTKYKMGVLSYGDGDFLCLSGEREAVLKVKSYQWDHVEHFVSTFDRRFKLPANAKTKQLKAYAENGVLTIMVPKMTSNDIQQLTLNTS